MLSSYLEKRVKEYDFSQIDKCWNDTLRFFFLSHVLADRPYVIDTKKDSLRVVRLIAMCSTCSNGLKGSDKLHY